MKKLLITLFLPILFLKIASAQDPCVRTSEGREFWVTFLDHEGSSGLNTQLYVTSRVATTGEVFRDGGATLETNINVVANGSQTITLSPSTTYIPNMPQIPQNKGVFVTTDDPVSLYAFNQKTFSADVALIFPAEALGTQYYTMCFTPSGDFRTEFVIVATEDDTNIEIIPSATTSMGNTAGSTISITLDRGQTYLVLSQIGQDLTGSYIESDKPIGVFSGNVRVAVDPLGGTSSDHLYEQLTSIDKWGREFVTIPSVRDNPAVLRRYDYYRIIARNDDTQVNISGNGTISLNAGQSYTFNTNGSNTPRIISSNEPIMIGQIALSSDRGITENADPYLTILSPNNQTLKDINLEALSTAQISTYHIDVVTKTTNTANIQLDGTAMSFTPIASSDMSYARRNITPGTHQLNNSDPANEGFIAYVYGYGDFESYGYLAGSSLETVVDVGIDTAYCDGSTSERILRGPDNFILYEWRKLPDATVLATTQEYAAIESGSYELTTQNEAGCVRLDTIEIVFSPPPSVKIKYRGDTIERNDDFERYLRICDETELQVLDATDPSHLPGSTFNWYIAGNPVPIAAGTSSLTLTDFSAITTYVFEVTNPATECNGRGSAFDSVTVELSPIPPIEITHNDTTINHGKLVFCNIDGEQLIKIRNNPNPDELEFSWYNHYTDELLVVGEEITVNHFSDTLTLRLETTHTNAIGVCAESDTVRVVFLPSALITHEDTTAANTLYFCDTQVEQTLQAGFHTFDTHVEYTWRDITDPFHVIELGTDYHIKADNLSDTTIYELTLTDIAHGSANFCKLKDTVTVIFFPNDFVDLREVGTSNFPDSIYFCAADGERDLEAVIPASFEPVMNIQWYELNGSSSTTLGTNAVQRVNAFQANQKVIRKYVAKLTNTLSDCEATDTITIVFLPPLNASLLGSTNICEGETTPVTFRLSGAFPMRLSYRETPLVGSPRVVDTYVGSTSTTSPFDYIIPSSGGSYQLLSLRDTLCSLATIPTTVVEVTVTPTPTVTISSPDTVICANETTKFVAAGATNYVFYKNGLPMPAGDVAGEYMPSVGTFQNGDRVWVIGETNGCPDTSRVMTVIVNPLPVVDLGVDKVKCKTDTTFLIAPDGDFIYDWKTYNRDGDIVQVGNGNDTLFVLDTGRYFLDITNIHTGCSNRSNTVHISNFDDEVVVNLGEDKTICDPTDVPYRLVASDFSHLNGTTYKWYVTGTNTIIGTDSVFDVNTENTYSVVVEDPRGCSISDTVRINFTATPDFVIHGHEEANCTPFDTLRIERSNVRNMLISWQGNGIVSLSDSNKVAIVNQSGIYTATVTDTSTVANCSYSQSVEVFVRPIIELGSTTNGDTLRLCEQDSLVLNAFKPEHNDNYTYKWRVIEGDRTVATTSRIAIRYDMVENYNANRFEITVSNPNGDCSVKDTVIVRFDRQSGVMIEENYEKTLCLGETQTLTAVGADAYQWSNGATTASISITPTEAGIYTFIINGRFSTPNRCGASADTIKFRVVNKPTVEIPEQLVLCESDSATISAFLPSHEPRYIYEWIDLTTGTVVDSSAAYTFKLDSSNLTYEPRRFSVGVYDTLGGGRCGESAEIEVIFNRSATTKITASDTLVCVKETITLTASGGTDFVWSTGETTPQITVSSDSAGIFKYSVKGSYGENACDSIETSILVQFKGIPTIKLNQPDSLSLCVGDSIVLIAKGGASYMWSHNPSVTSDTTVVYPTQTTTYIVTGFDTLGCSNTDTLKVIVEPRIDLGADIQVCEGDTVKIGAPRPEGAIYRWNTGETSDTIAVTRSGKYFVEVKINECNYTDSIQVSFLEAPILHAKDTVLCFEDENGTRIFHELGVQIRNYDSTARYLYQWRNERGEIVGSDSLLRTRFDGTFLVRVTAAYDNGCSAMTSLAIEGSCEPQIFVPSAFTPNGDYLNEEWEIFGRFYANLRIRVLDRWGMVMYESETRTENDEIDFWDGTYKGKKVPSGVYYYQITYNSPTNPSQTIKQTGSVTVIY